MDGLRGWSDTATTQAIVDFVRCVTTEGGPDFVPRSERTAVYDNDGTLWCEKPIPIELGFILRRFVELAEADESLRDRQPWKAAWEQDHGWLAGAMTKHYGGDDGDLHVFAYTAGAEQALQRAGADSWTVVMKNDWSTVFAET